MVALPPCLRSFTLLDLRSVVCQSCEVPWTKLTRKSEFVWEPGAGPGARWTRVRRRIAARIHWLSRPTRCENPQSARRVAGPFESCPPFRPRRAPRRPGATHPRLPLASIATKRGSRCGLLELIEDAQFQHTVLRIGSGQFVLKAPFL